MMEGILKLTSLEEKIKSGSELINKALNQASKIVVGQGEMLESIMMGMLTGGHILLEGVPGLAKTLAISTFSKVVSLNFQRIQFTPDLLPSDLIGTMIFNQKTGDFVPKKGPIFTHLVLADEINRAPAKVQSALLEAMAEKQVTIGDHSYPLDHPFLVLATQNPIEQEGTYPLPEAQMDRFMFKVVVNYPNKQEEKQILENMSDDREMQPDIVMTREDLIHISQVVHQIYMDQKVKDYIVDLVMCTRSPKEYGLNLENFLQIGVSPRATIHLTRASRAYAYLRNRNYVTIDDVKTIAYRVLRHRLLLTYEAEAEEYTSDQIIKKLLSHIG